MAVNDVEASNFTYMLRCSRHLLSILVLSSVLGGASAAELGEARVSSHTGQPLVADIELVMIDDPSAAVAVRIASPEVYNGAGIAMPPVLGSVSLSVMRRDGRQFLHVTSLRPVDADHLHLYLELQDKGQRAVRLATLWLTPDPNPAPPPPPLPAVVRAEPAALPAPASESVAVPAPRPLAVRKAEEPVKARPHARAPAEAVRAEPKAAPPRPLPIHAPQPAPAACAHQAEQARVCAALDARNAALTAKIGNLEGKVKSLQATLGAPAAAAPAPTPMPAPTLAPAAASTPAPAPAREAAHAPPGPKPIHAIKPLVPRKPKAPAPAPEAGLPWGWIGGGAALLLALAGAFLLLLRRRARTLRNVDIPAASRLVDRLRGRLPTRGKAASKAVEPSLE
jgi:hypothetical protein